MLLINELFKSRLSENKNHKLRYNVDKRVFPVASYSNSKINIYYSLLYKCFYFLDNTLKLHQKIKVSRKQLNY
jgi:hypothetical protein